MRTILATLLLVATTGAASAYCVSAPDTQASGYVNNNTSKSVCLNDELAGNTADKNWQVKVDTALGQLDRDYVSKKLDAVKPIPPISPQLPTWP